MSWDSGLSAGSIIWTLIPFGGVGGASFYGQDSGLVGLVCLNCCRAALMYLGMDKSTL